MDTENYNIPIGAIEKKGLLNKKYPSFCLEPPSFAYICEFE